VAVKENGVIYVGADSQSTAGRRKFAVLNESGFKVVRLDNDILVGICGSASAGQMITSLTNVFTLDENGVLTKKHIVNEIIPNLIDHFEEIGIEERGDLEISLLLAHKDKLYKITSGMTVININEFTGAGAGEYYVYYPLEIFKDMPVKERIITALVESAKRTGGVSGPYVLIDTKDLKYEIIDKGGENY
jgi:ATP-dependent protease HslVU (ClpYQ) peptidase subunit